MRLLKAAALLLCATTLVMAQDSPSLINVTDKAAIEAAKDQRVVVEGKVSKAEWSKSGKVINIEFENAPHFMAAAFEKSRVKLDAAFGGNFAQSLTGAKVKVTGKVTAYGGKAKEFEGTLQMVINDVTQITIVEAGPTTAPTTAPTAP